MEKLTRESSCDENKRKDFPRWKIYLPNGRPQEGKWRKSYYPQLWNPGIYSMKNGTFSLLCLKQEYLGLYLCIRSRSDHFLALSKPSGLCWDLKDLTLGFRYTCSILELNVFVMCLLSPSGDLGVRLVWHNLSPPDHPTPPTFWSECWNPLQTEINYLWGVLSCSQDIRWF